MSPFKGSFQDGSGSLITLVVSEAADVLPASSEACEQAANKKVVTQIIGRSLFILKCLEISFKDISISQSISDPGLFNCLMIDTCHH
jgi:hypothetical protein